MFFFEHKRLTVLRSIPPFIGLSHLLPDRRFLGKSELFSKHYNGLGKERIFALCSIHSFYSKVVVLTHNNYFPRELTGVMITYIKIDISVSIHSVTVDMITVTQYNRGWFFVKFIGFHSLTKLKISSACACDSARIPIINWLSLAPFCLGEYLPHSLNMAVAPTRLRRQSLYPPLL